MKELKFKTNINCGGCVATVSTVLDYNKKVKKWSVDLFNPDRILSIQTEDLTPEEVKEDLKKIGYQAELLPLTNLSG